MLKKEEQNTITTNAKKLAKFFEIKVELKIFGQTIIEWVWPPK